MNEISISKELKNFLQQLKTEHNLGNIWLAKKYNKRWDYIFGFRSRQPLPTKKLLINDELALFVDSFVAMDELHMINIIKDLLNV